MFKITLYISSRLSYIDIDKLKFPLKNNNDNLNIIISENFNINNVLDLDKMSILDTYINFNGMFSNDYSEIFLKNKVFINNFFNNKDLLSSIYYYNEDYNIFHYSFISKKYNSFYIKQKIDLYNKLYDNDKINKDYGKDLWIVKNINLYNSFDILILNSEELINYDNDNIFILKYLEKSNLINNKKYSLIAHFFIFPKIIKKNNIYVIDYDENNNIKYKLFYYDFLMIKDSFNDIETNSIHIQNIHLVQFSTYKHIKDDILKKLIIDKVKLLSTNNKFIETIINSIYSYPYFGQIISIDFDVDLNKNNIYIEKISTKISLHYDEINKSNLIYAFFQKIFKYIYKIKHNILLCYKIKYTKDLIKI